jgi:CheY-like chemotaxis protein
MKILIADDEGPKLESIRLALLHAFDQETVIATARSVRSAIQAVKNSRFDAMLLDMSLPTFDVSQGEMGGRPQGFGGIEVLRYMDFYDLSCPVVVITQYEAFAENGKHMDLSSLAERLRRDHNRNFVEIIYYGGSADQIWPERLSTLLSTIFARTDENPLR